MGYFDFLSKVTNADQASGETRVIMSVKATATSAETTVMAKPTTTESTRRFSLPSLNFTRRDQDVHRTALPAVQEKKKREHALESSIKRALKVSRSDKRAKSSALALRSLIVGPTSTVDLQTTHAVAKPELRKIKSQLMNPKTANQVIAQLKELPASDDPLYAHTPGAKCPIHAVCLAYTDAEVDTLHFSKLTSSSSEKGLLESAHIPDVVSVSVDKLAALFNEMHIVNLVNAPDFGLGQPGDGEGILAGALPTAETVIEGVRQITPELMALGYATGKAITPDHSGLYPPTDRMSVLTYWWGFELLLPPPSLVYLSRGHSITNAVMNFLSALALINNGIREILPFIRYIAQFVDFEFNAIKKQDMGKGVVCAATWVMPAALVPRPWDFPSPPLPTEVAADTTDAPDDLPPLSVPHDTPEAPDSSPELPVENPLTPQAPVVTLVASS